MIDLIEYLERTEEQANELIVAYKRLRKKETFNSKTEEPLMRSIDEWLDYHKAIEKKKKSIILKFEIDKTHARSFLNNFTKLHELIYLELVEREIYRLDDVVNEKFILFITCSKSLINYFTKELKKIEYHIQLDNAEKCEYLTYFVAYYKAYLSNAESIIKSILPKDKKTALKRLKNLSINRAKELDEPLCASIMAQKELEYLLTKDNEGTRALFRNAVNDLDDIYLEFERIIEEQNLNALIAEVSPFHYERGLNFGELFCWLKGVQPFESRVPKTICAKHTDEVKKTDHRNADEKTALYKRSPFKTIQQFNLFLYLHNEFNHKDKNRWTYIYEGLNDYGNCKLSQEPFFEFISGNYQTVAKRKQETANESYLVNIIENLCENFELQ